MERFLVTATCMGAMVSLDIEAPTALAAFKAWEQEMTPEDKELVTCWGKYQVNCIPIDKANPYLKVFTNGKKFVNDGNDHLRGYW